MQSSAGPVLCVPPDPDVVTILVAGANPIYAAGLKSVLEPNPDVNVVATAASFDEMVRIAKRTSPSIIIVDEYLIEREAERLKWVIRALPRIRIIVSVAKEDCDFSLALLHAGARAVIPCDVNPVHLSRGIQVVMRDGYWVTTCVQRWLVEYWQKTGAPSTAGRKELPLLSDKESIAVSMIVARKPNAHIALRLGTSEQCVKNMLSRLYKRFDVKDRNILRSALVDLGYPPIY